MTSTRVCRNAARTSPINRTTPNRTANKVINITRATEKSLIRLDLCNHGFHRIFKQSTPPLRSAPSRAPPFRHCFFSNVGRSETCGVAFAARPNPELFRLGARALLCQPAICLGDDERRRLLHPSLRCVEQGPMCLFCAFPRGNQGNISPSPPDKSDLLTASRV